MKTVCKVDCCTGCRACVQKCVKHAILINDSTDALNAVINSDICINCGVCTNVCPVNNNVVNFIKPFEWYQGWSIDESIRRNSTSGGFATSIAKHFIEIGGFVCSCIFDNGDFVYKVTHPKHEIRKTYTVTVKGIIKNEEVEQLRKGVKIDDYTTRPAKVKILKTDEEKDISRLEITIHEGKNRQVRRMCESVGRRVIALHRSKIGNIGVKDIELGKWRYLKDFEVKTLIGK